MSHSSEREIGEWFDRGKKSGATHMLVVCDTFDWEDFPVYVMPSEDAQKKYDSFHGQNMTKVMEVYAMHLPKDAQLAEFRARHLEAPHSKGVKV
jgi:hypothetical protein